MRFPNLGAHDVIVPGTARLAFTISLNSTNANRVVVQNLGRAVAKQVVVQNLGRAVVKKTTIKISGNEVMSIDDTDVYNCYNDLWLTKQEQQNMTCQGIGIYFSILKLRVGAGDRNAAVGTAKATADAYGKRFYIPLDFELLQSHTPFYQRALGDCLEYELTAGEPHAVLPESAGRLPRIRTHLQRLQQSFQDHRHHSCQLHH